jgi:hypothetical protein
VHYSRTLARSFTRAAVQVECLNRLRRNDEEDQTAQKRASGRVLRLKPEVRAALFPDAFAKESYEFWTR